MTLATLPRHFDRSRFASLPNVDGAAARLERSRDALPSIGRVLVRHGVEDVLGVGLLHRHFDLYDDEVLVESTTASGSLLRPAEASGSAYLWAWSAGEWSALEFLAPADGAEGLVDRAAASADSGAFLGDFAAAVEQTGTADVFGLVTLHRPFPDGEDEIWLETEASSERLLSQRMVPRSATHDLGGLMLQTAWRFSDTAGNEVGMCSNHCFHCSHCSCSNPDPKQTPTDDERGVPDYRGPLYMR